MSANKRGPSGRLLCVALWMMLAVASLPSLAQTPEAPPAKIESERRPLQFKPEPSVADSSEAKVWVALVVLLGLAIPALYWLRRKHPMFGAGLGGSKLRVVEMRSVGPRLTLYLIEVKGEEILLAQSGDKVIQVAIKSHPVSEVSRVEDLQRPVG